MNRLLVAISAVMVLLSGCNTIAGLGKDVQRAGEVVQGAAK